MGTAVDDNIQGIEAADGVEHLQRLRDVRGRPRDALLSTVSCTILNVRARPHASTGIPLDLATHCSTSAKKSYISHRSERFSCGVVRRR